MAYLKRKSIKSNLNKTISYISDEEKRDVKKEISYITDTGKVYKIGSVNCSCNPNLALKQFQQLKESFNKNDKVLAHHYIQSFDPSEEIDKELAFKIGKEFAEKNFKECQVIFSTHKDKKHIHNHFIVNSVLLSGKKFDSKTKTLYDARRLSNEICKKYNVKIIEGLGEKENFNFKEQLVKNDIDVAIKKSKNYDEFIKILIKNGYTIKDKKYISFTPKGYKKAIRNKILGESYSKENIKKRIENKNIIENKKGISNKNKFKIIQFSNQYSNKNQFNIKKEIFKNDIKDSIKSSSNYFQFVQIMKDKNYFIENNTKNLFFKHKSFNYKIKDINLGNECSYQNILRCIENKKLLSKDDPVKKQIIDILKQTTYVDKAKRKEDLYMNLKKLDYLNKTNINLKSSKEDILKNHKNLEIKSNQKNEDLKAYILAIKELNNLKSTINFYQKNKQDSFDNEKIYEIENYFFENEIDLARLDKVLKNIDIRLEKFEHEKVNLNKEIKELQNDIEIIFDIMKNIENKQIELEKTR